jgi:hypothetical protein
MDRSRVMAGYTLALKEDESSSEIRSSEYYICSPPTLTPQLSEESRWVISHLETIIYNPFSKWLKIIFDNAEENCKRSVHKSPLEAGAMEGFFHSYELLICNFSQLLEVYNQLEFFFKRGDLKKLLVLDLELKNYAMSYELKQMLYDAIALKEFRLFMLINKSSQRYEEYYFNNENKTCSRFLELYEGSADSDFHIHVEFSTPALLLREGIIGRHI